MQDIFKASSDYPYLSLKDLLGTRDLFHYHLLNKKNVVVTALGLYRICHQDSWPSREQPRVGTGPKQEPRRTLFNFGDRPVFLALRVRVRFKLGRGYDLSKDNPADVVPKALFLPDGRSVPACGMTRLPRRATAALCWILLQCKVCPAG